MGALHRAKRISTSSESDMKEITEIHRKAGYPISASFKPQSTVSVTKQTRTRVLSQCERENTRTSFITPSQPVTSQNIQPTHKHETLRAPRKPPFGGKYNGRPANCLRGSNPKQTSTFFYCETVPLENNFIEQNQVVCKFPPCTPLMMTVRLKTFWFFKNQKN